MIDAVEWNPKHHGHKPPYWKPDMEASLDGKNFVRQEPGQDWAWIAGSIYYVPYEAVYGVPRPEVVEEGVEPVDPLLEAVGEAMQEHEVYSKYELTESLHKALAKRGLKIVETGQ